MAKKSMIARDVKRKKMAERYAAKRAALMAAFNAADDPMDRLEIHRKIQALPRNSAPQPHSQSLPGHRQTPGLLPRFRPVP